MVNKVQMKKLIVIMQELILKIWIWTMKRCSKVVGILTNVSIEFSLN